MERELWPLLYHAAREEGQRISQKYVRYQPWVPALVLLWAALHDRPIRWACDRHNWRTTRLRPDPLPAASTVSRRLRSQAVAAVLRAVEARLRAGGHRWLAAVVDGKPLTVGGNSHDPDAARGRGAGGMARGYKLHAIWAGRATPEAWEVTPLSAAEAVVAQGLVDRAGGGGYLLGDGNYDGNALSDRAAAAGYQLVVPIKHANAGAGHHYQSPSRLRSIELMRAPFGRSLYRLRGRIEGAFGSLVAFGGGLGCGLPAWVRRAWRVRNWVWAKLLINAVRQLRVQRLAAQTE
jgi:hypothetical protein